jgi:hypothetical protein
LQPERLAYLAVLLRAAAVVALVLAGALAATGLLTLFAA